MKELGVHAWTMAGKAKNNQSKKRVSTGVSRRLRKYVGEEEEGLVARVTVSAKLKI